MKPLVSILIPAYNAERWIAQAIESALSQTWPAKELIVVDDGSRDATLAVAKKYASKNVQVVAQANQGAAAARNHALRLSQGEYVQWLDADDCLDAGKVEAQFRHQDALDDNFLLSSAWARFYKDVSEVTFRPNPLWANLTPLEFLVLKLEHCTYMTIQCWLMNRRLADLAGPWDTSLSTDDDGEYFCRVLMHSAGVRFVPEAKSYYRAATAFSQSSMLGSRKKVDSQFRSMCLHIKYLRSMEDSSRTRAACLSYLQGCSIFFYPEWPDYCEKAQALATELGGQLEAPRLARKYELLRMVFGWHVAKRAHFLFPSLKASVRDVGSGLLPKFRAAR